MSSVDSWVNATNFTSVMQIANDNSGGHFWVGILYMFWFILTVGLSPFGLTSALLTSSFATFVSGFFLLYMGLISYQYLAFPVAVIIISILYIVWNSNR